MNNFNLIDAQKVEDRLAQVQLEEMDGEKEFNYKESIFQSELLTLGIGYAATDFGW